MKAEKITIIILLLTLTSTVFGQSELADKNSNKMPNLILDIISDTTIIIVVENWIDLSK